MFCAGQQSCRRPCVFAVQEAWRVAPPHRTHSSLVSVQQQQRGIETGALLSRREKTSSAEKETPLDKQTGSGRGGNSESSTSKKRRQKQNSPSQQSSQVSGGTQESEKVWQYLKGRLQLELGNDVTNQREVLLLCCTLSDVEERVERLLEAGFSEEWAAILLPLFPPLWDVDVTHMRRVLELLEERGFGGNALKKIVSEHSYLLMEDRQLVSVIAVCCILAFNSPVCVCRLREG